MDGAFEQKPPAFDRKLSKSKDGKWLIIRTIRTDILPINYIKKILESEGGDRG